MNLNLTRSVLDGAKELFAWFRDCREHVHDKEYVYAACVALSHENELAAGFDVDVTGSTTAVADSLEAVQKKEKEEEASRQEAAEREAAEKKDPVKGIHYGEFFYFFLFSLFRSIGLSVCLCVSVCPPLAQNLSRRGVSVCL